MALNSTPRTWVTGEIVTAAQLNAELRDAVTGIQSAWTAYTPVVSGFSTAVTTTLGRYQRVGKSITGWAEFTLVSGLTGSGVLGITLPTAASGNYPANGVGSIGTAEYQNAAGVYVTGLLEQTPSSALCSFLMASPGGATPNLFRATGAIPAGQSTGDYWFFAFAYEAA